MELSAYRIVQEALSNVPAPRARRDVPGSRPHDLPVGLALRVVSNTAADRTPGKPSPGAGHGLPGMRERVAMLERRR
ncbi:histidine kinase [Streptomyces violaceorubidus]